MKHSTFAFALSASLLVGAANCVYAADAKTDPADGGTPARIVKEPSRKPSPKFEEKRKQASKIKLVDINNASSDQLMKLPGISDTEAARIIAGRPYATKAHLVTRNIINAGVYEGLRKLVIAKQPNKDAARNAALYAPKSAPTK